MANIDLKGILSEGIIVVILAFFIHMLFLRFQYHHLYAETVSQSRMQWIDNFREELATFIGCACGLFYESKIELNKSCNGKKNDDETLIQLIAKAEKARAKLRTRLNMDITRKGNEYNLLFDNALKNIDLNKLRELNEVHIENLIDLSRKILEPEWQRVKLEAKGKKWESNI